MDEVWGVEVATSRGHKVYHAAFASETEAKTEVLKINEDESPLVEGVMRTPNIFHLQEGVCRQILP